MEIVYGIIKESVLLTNKMSIYLLFGFLVAGILHIFISARSIAKHLGKNDILSIIKASLFGVPLPLCSCGVIPAAVSLKREGAGNGAVLAFLISTPTTGVDSILATYSLLGPFFTVYRILASFFSGFMSGILANLFLKSEINKMKSPKQENGGECIDCDINHEDSHFSSKLKAVFNYAFIDLLGSINKTLITGIILGGIITYIIPDDFFSKYIGGGILELVAMLVIGIPIYVCATGSIPIAAALILKGISPGAAFVFLLSGPATNAVTITVIAKEMGKKAVALYLFSISSASFILGFLLNVLWYKLGVSISGFESSQNIIPGWLGKTSSVILIGLIIYTLVKEKFLNGGRVMEMDDKFESVKIEGMTCQHCVNNVRGMFKNIFDMDVEIDLKNGLVKLPSSSVDRTKMKEEIEKIGYNIAE